MDKESRALLYERLIEEGKEIANVNCAGGYPNRDDCTWYHGNWMLLRYLGLVSNPYWHEDFYKNAISAAFTSTSNVLVLATADFSMPMLCSESGVETLDISDICPTPLEICKKVADLLNLKWETHVQNVFDSPSKAYHIIVNDAFLSRFPQKEAVLNAIAARLINRGYYITTLKQGKINTGGEIPQDVRIHFINKAVNRYAMQKKPFQGFDIEKITNTYVEKMSSYPVSNEKELITLFNNSGLEIEHMEMGHVVGEFEESDYYRVISRKR